MRKRVHQLIDCFFSFRALRKEKPFADIQIIIFYLNHMQEFIRITGTMRLPNGWKWSEQRSLSKSVIRDVFNNMRAVSDKMRQVDILGRKRQKMTQTNIMKITANITGTERSSFVAHYNVRLNRDERGWYWHSWQMNNSHFTQKEPLGKLARLLWWFLIFCGRNEQLNT